MPSYDGAGCSEDTVIKQAHFAKFLYMHMNICKGQIRKANAGYVFFDLHAGPGTTYNQDGSPLIFARRALECPFPCQSYHFDKNVESCRTLSSQLQSVTDMQMFTRHQFNVVPGDHNNSIDRVLQPYQESKTPLCGLIYADPNGEGISVDVINKILSVPSLSRLEVLINVNASAIKRSRLRFPLLGKPDLAAQLDRVKKSVVILREPVGIWQFSLVLLTNWAEFPVMEHQGFHKMNTLAGQEIIRELNLTHKEKSGRLSPPRLSIKPQLGFKF